MKIASLVVTVETIPAEGLNIPLNIGADDVVSLISVEGEAPPVIASPLTGSLNVVRLGRRIRMRGDFQVSVSIPCDRCLKDTEAALDGRVNETAEMMFPGDQAADGDDSESCLEVVDGQVDLSGLLREFFWLAWPFRFICHEDCAGLCPHCGEDLNSGTCKCSDDLAWH